MSLVGAAQTQLLLSPKDPIKRSLGARHRAKFENFENL